MWKNEYMKLCFESITLDDISAGMELKFKHIPSKLYRYRPFNEFSLDEISKKYVRLVSAKKFNDLLDTRGRIDIYNQFLKNSLGMKTNFENHLKEHFDSKEVQAMLGTDDWLEEILNGVSKKVAKESSLSEMECKANLIYIINQETNELNDAFGSLGHYTTRCSCFTERNDNLAMWYHYANQYSGICIEYDMSQFDILNSRSRFMYPVIYAETLPDINEQIKNFETQHVNLYTWVALHKKMEWNYEDEWRLVFNGIYKEDTNLYFPAISAIYLGNKIKDKNKKRIINLVRNENINIYNMVLENNSILFRK